MKTEHGFSLVELALVLIIFGMVTSMITLGMKMYMNNESFERTIESIDETQNAIFAYQLGVGKYPCPADPTLGPNDANYGVADCDNANLIIRNGRPAAITDSDGDGVLEPCGDDLAGPRLRVLIGAVPFADLLDHDGNPNTDPIYPDYRQRHSMDGYGNKLTYAVTEDLANDLTNANAVPFNGDNGAICVHDEFDRNLLEIPGTAHIVIASHGENGIGAWNEEGNTVDDCVDVVVVPPTHDENKIPKDERENCDHEEALTEQVVKFIRTTRNESRNDYYDDTVRFMVSSVSELWTNTGIILFDNGTPGDPSDDFFINQIANTNGGNVGIGEDSPQEQLHVDGDIKAFEMHVEGICDGTGSDCMPIDALGGEMNDMKCPNGQVVTHIEQNKVFCASPFPASAFTACGTDAGGNQLFMTGISNKTGPICTLP